VVLSEKDPEKLAIGMIAMVMGEAYLDDVDCVIRTRAQIIKRSLNYTN
jgi:hypothetical protein